MLESWVDIIDTRSSSSVNLGVAKVHLGMLVLELLKDIQAILLVRGRQALFLLLLVEHHLLDHAARLAIEVGQFGVVGLDLGHIDLGGRGDNVCPPLHLVDLVEVDFDRLGVVRVGREGPG